jgi:hypothetical protein
MLQQRTFPQKISDIYLHPTAEGLCRANGTTPLRIRRHSHCSGSGVIHQ